MNRHDTGHATHQSGFSLVELMVALVLGLILTSGVISVYITSKSTYNINNALGAVQEHGRFALSFMDPKIRMAGFSGCQYAPGGNNKISAALRADPVYSFTSAVYGYEANGTGIGSSLTLTAAINSTPPVNAALWSPALNAGGYTALYNAVSPKALQGSDIFMVHEMQANPPALVGVFDDLSNLYVPDASVFNVGEYVLATTCSQTPNINFFQITARDTGANTITYGAGGTLGNVGTTLTGNYILTGGSVGAALTYAYYVGKGVDGGPALYQASLDSATGAFTAQELVSGIENMQVVYGYDDPANKDQIPDNFQTANTVTDWTRVVSVRVAMVARSDDNSTDNIASTAPVFYMLASDPAANANGDAMTLTTTKDRRLRRYFVQTFSVRNTLP